MLEAGCEPGRRAQRGRPDGAAAPATAATNALRACAGSLRPGAASTPLATSTAHGLRRGDRVADVRRRQPAARGSAAAVERRARDQLPVERLPGAAAQVRGVRRRAGGSRCGSARAPGGRPASATRTALITRQPVRRATSRAVGRALVAVQLQHASGRPRRPSRATSSSVALTKTPHDLGARAAGRGDLDGVLLGGSGAARARRKIIPTAHAPRLDGQLGVGAGGDAADLDAGRGPRPTS